MLIHIMRTQCKMHTRLEIDSDSVGVYGAHSSTLCLSVEWYNVYQTSHIVTIDVDTVSNHHGVERAELH